MIDVHAHMCWKDYDNDINDIISRCRKELSAVIVGSARYDEGVKTLELCKKYPNFLFPSLGFHPIEGGNNPDQIIDLIKKNVDKTVAVGEVGLDYHWEKNSNKREKQKKVFSKFIDLAKRIKKPLVIHSWDAERECFEMVKDLDIPVVFHCFSGKRALAKEIIEQDFYLSLSTMVLFSKNIRKVAKDVPLDQLLLETDSPFLSPEKNKDPRNYPWNIKISAAKIAKIKNIPTEDVLRNAEKNAVNIFNLKIAQR